MASMKVLAAAIRALEDEEGRLTPRKVVDAARAGDHPLHDEFEWNDKKAAERDRLNTARHLLARVRYEITTDTRRIAVVGYIRDPDAIPRQGVIAVSKLRTDRDASIEALLAECSHVQGRLERVRELAQALDLEAELTQMLDAVETLRSRIRRGVTAGEARVS